MKNIIRNFLAPREMVIKIINGGFYEVPGQGKSYYGKRAEQYNEKRVSGWDWQLEQSTVKQFLSELPDGMSVLDVPFGTGRFVPFYLEKNMRVFGLEKSPDMLMAAQKSLGEKYASCHVDLGDAVNLKYRDNYFDLVVSSRFLPHIISYQQARVALQEFCRVTKQYALLQISERKNNQYRRRLPREHEKMESWLYPEEIEELLNNVGFFVLQKSGPVKNATTTTAKRLSNIGKWHFYLCEKIT